MRANPYVGIDGWVILRADVLGPYELKTPRIAVTFDFYRDWIPRLAGEA